MPHLSLGQIPKAAQLIKNDGAQSTGILHSQLQSGIGFFLTRVVMDNTATEGGALIRVQTVASQLAACHLTDGMDEVPTVQILKSVLVRIVSVGPMVKLMS